MASYSGVSMPRRRVQRGRSYRVVGDISKEAFNRCLCNKEDEKKKCEFYKVGDDKSPEYDKEELRGKIFRELKKRGNLLKQEIKDNYEITKGLAGLDACKADRIYKLSVTDLFVEKAISLLSKKANLYNTLGKVSFALATLVIVSGVFVSAKQLDLFGDRDERLSSALQNRENVVKLYADRYKVQQYGANAKDGNTSLAVTNEALLKELVSREVNFAWMDATTSFMKSFTFYGLLVLVAVFLKRFGKASMDQAERIHDRSHALRQGRLYIHLKNGDVKTVEELELAFNWNSSQSNAFADINTEAQAPWGNALKEVLNMFPKAIEASRK